MREDLRSGDHRQWAKSGMLPAIIASGIVLAWLLLPPHLLLDKADHAAFAVCHRIAERSFFVGGRQLPLCARCSGMYLGALAAIGILVARGRGKAAGFPSRGWLTLLAVFTVAWAVDGANSFLSLFPVFPRLYEPSNLLRLLTGALQGVTLASLLLPAFNLALWVHPVPERSLRGSADLAWLLAGAGVVVTLVAAEWAPLLYPLALISGAAVVVLLGMVNTMLALILLRREGRIAAWRQAAAPVLLGVGLAIVELTAIGAARATLTERFNLPF